MILAQKSHSGKIRAKKGRKFPVVFLHIVYEVLIKSIGVFSGPQVCEGLMDVFRT
jgi:hypothetical protein